MPLSSSMVNRPLCSVAGRPVNRAIDSRALYRLPVLLALSLAAIRSLAFGLIHVTNPGADWRSTTLVTLAEGTDALPRQMAILALAPNAWVIGPLLIGAGGWLLGRRRWVGPR